MKINKTARIIILVGLAGLIISLGQSRRQSQLKQYSQTGEFFGSYVKIDVCHSSPRLPQVQAALDKVWQRFADIHTRLSVYDAQSDINKINQAYDKPGGVSRDTYMLVEDSIRYHALSSGVFDITVGPLIQLWKRKGKEGVMPTPEEIAEAKFLVNIDAIELFSNQRIRLNQPGVKINVDSIGDGFAADEAARILRERGFYDFLVDASGEIYAAGSNCQRDKWRIGVRDPEDTSKLMDTLEINNLAVSTSGNYERFFMIDGKKWPHIIDPRSGFPAVGVESATVIAPSAQMADFLSTALCILKPQEGIRIVDALGQDHGAMVMAAHSGGQNKKYFSKSYIHFQQTKSAGE
jgi:thiamine biosynthesis lipoprotein